MIQKEDKSSYRHIMKATSLFGGVQVFNILIALVRSKFIAIFLGTQGVGLAGLLQNTIGLISSSTGLGIGFSAVRDISEASNSNDHSKISRTITTFRRWVWFTGLIGTFLTIVLAKQLSIWTFGSSEYTFAFIWLAITLLFNSLATGQYALLQGTRMLKEMAKATMLGSVIGLFISVPFYYFFGLDGIVPTIFITSLSTLIIAFFFARQLKFPKAEIHYRSSFFDGLKMVKLGIMITISGFVTSFVTYMVNIYISHNGGLAIVGLYQAGLSITDKYVGVIFAAMATDYFPRLAAINSDNKELRKMVNQQAEIAILIISPILIALISTIPIIIQILFTKEFYPIVGFVQWIVIGMIFKATSWTMGYIILAKGDSKLFIFTELMSNLLILVLNIGGYHFWGLEGLGLSFLVSYTFILAFIYILVSKRYNFSFNYVFIKLFIIQFLGCSTAFILARIFGYPWAYLSGSILFLGLGYYSWREIDKRIALKNLLYRKFRRSKNE